MQTESIWEDLWSEFEEVIQVRFMPAEQTLQPLIPWSASDLEIVFIFAYDLCFGYSELNHGSHLRGQDKPARLAPHKSIAKDPLLSIKYLESYLQHLARFCPLFKFEFKRVTSEQLHLLIFQVRPLC